MVEYIVKETDCHFGTRQEVVGELIRCRNCRYIVKGQDADTHDYFHHCNYWQADTVPDGFCHEAEEEGEADEVN